METTIEKTREETIQEILQMDRGIRKFHEKLMALSQDKEFLRQYHLREKMLSNWATDVNAAFDNGMIKGRIEGFDKGFEQGEMKKQTEIAKNLLHEGIPVEVIKKITGLDAKTIQSLE